ncbi:hypothetical protein, partial [Xanthomonas translucens]|uniref:hypothetical protein n=1 Tax=Xanthomonas campestris pv. translucens TaxID=343 RepID=UPI001BB00E45
WRPFQWDRFIYPLFGTAPKRASLKQGRLFGRLRLRCSARFKAKTIKSHRHSHEGVVYAMWPLAILDLVSVCKIIAIDSA